MKNNTQEVIRKKNVAIDYITGEIKMMKNKRRKRKGQDNSFGIIKIKKDLPLLGKV